MDENPVTGHRGAWLAHHGLRVSLPLLRGLYVGVALLGLLATPVVTLLWAPVVGVAIAGLFVSIVCYCDPRWYTRRIIAGVAVAGAVFLPFVGGLTLLQGIGGVLGVVFLSLVAVAVSGWVHRFSIGTGTPADRGAATDLDVLQEMVHVVPLEVLFTEWRACQGEPAAGDGDRRHARTAIRAMLLDEMERRDAEGFARWLGQGATEPPDGYIRDDQGLAA